MSLHPRRTRAAVAATASVAIAGLISPIGAQAQPAPEPGGAPGTAPAADHALIISEYIEGTSNNKGLEIYHTGTEEVDLSDYRIQGYQNGNTSVNYTVPLTGTLAPGEVHVVAHPSAAFASEADQTAQLQFNGDDVVVLVGTEDEFVDSIGRIGEQPDGGWGSGDFTTENNTMRRMVDICEGDTDPTDAYDPVTEWDGFPVDTFDGLGEHTAECVPAGPQAPVINEFSASTTGDDVEFLEVYGEPEADYSELSILQVKADVPHNQTGQVLSVHEVGTTDVDGFWSTDLATDTLQNGSISLLLVSGSTAEVGTVLDTDQDGTIDQPAWEELLDDVAIVDGDDGDLAYSETVLEPEFDGAPYAPGAASRIPDGTDTDTTADWVRNDFNLAGIGGEGTPEPGQAWNTPGAPNEVYEEELPPPGGVCGDPATLIGAVQGPGETTPIPGEIVTIEGIVVGDFQEGGFNGFFVQDEGDDDPATSDGIFIYAPNGPEVEVADQVRVTGTAAEFEGKTQLTSPTYEVCDTGVELPEATEVVFPVTAADLESVEGMHVTFPETLSILEYYNYGRFGEVVLGTGLGTERQFQPTALAAPDSAEAIEVRDHNATHRIMLDDGLSPQNPPYLRHPAGGQFTLEHTFRGGDTLTNVTGVMDFSFGAYKVQPTADADFEAANPRPTDVPEMGGATMTVAAFNVLNYFTDLDGRGADTPEEFERQEVKIVAALAEMDADVVGLIEIENNGDVAVAALTDALNEEVGAGTYDYLETGVIGTDEITMAYIYQPAQVTPEGDFALLDSSVDERFLDQYNRPVLAQTFEENATGEQVTVAVNHLKSKGSSCDAVGDPEDPWAGNCNQVRTDAAEAMVDWLAEDPTDTGSEHSLVIGDLNAYDKETPIDVLVDNGYTDLLLEHQGEHEYTYVFDGQLGYLDHALANEALSEKVVAAEAWKINADEASVLDYDMTFKPDEQAALFEPNAFRSSDHDPILVGLDLAQEEPGPDPVEVDRLAGEHRYETAALAALEFGPVDTVYLASGEEFPDALTGTAPAVRDGAPVLLTKSGQLPVSAGDALEQVAPENVYALGGPVAISDAVLADVAARTGAEVTRVSGEHRYGTAAALAAERFAAVDVDTVYIASGAEYADSLAGGPLAGLGNDPILLTGTGHVPQDTVAALTELEPEQIVVLGGSARIPDSILTALEPYADTVERLAGEDRYETATLVAERIAPSGSEFVASGQAFPDALAGGALAGLHESPVLLTKAENLPEVTGAALVAREPATVTLLGGQERIPEAVRTAIEELFQP